MNRIRLIMAMLFLSIVGAQVNAMFVFDRGAFKQAHRQTATAQAAMNPFAMDLIDEGAMQIADSANQVEQPDLPTSAAEEAMVTEVNEQIEAAQGQKIPANELTENMDQKAAQSFLKTCQEKAAQYKDAAVKFFKLAPDYVKAHPYITTGSVIGLVVIGGVSYFVYSKGYIKSAYAVIKEYKKTSAALAVAATGVVSTALIYKYGMPEKVANGFSALKNGVACAAQRFAEVVQDNPKTTAAVAAAVLGTGVVAKKAYNAYTAKNANKEQQSQPVEQQKLEQPEKEEKALKQAKPGMFTNAVTYLYKHPVTTAATVAGTGALIIYAAKNGALKPETIKNALTYENAKGALSSGWNAMTDNKIANAVSNGVSSAWNAVKNHPWRTGAGIAAAAVPTAMAMQKNTDATWDDVAKSFEELQDSIDPDYYAKKRLDNARTTLQDTKNDLEALQKQQFNSKKSQEQADAELARQEQERLNKEAQEEARKQAQEKADAALAAKAQMNELCQALLTVKDAKDFKRLVTEMQILAAKLQNPALTKAINDFVNALNASDAKFIAYPLNNRYDTRTNVVKAKIASISTALKS